MINDSELIQKEHVYSGILAGAERVFKHREVLNQSNGFPVPDRDTGNNLSYLMQNISRNLVLEETIKDLLDSVSDLAVINSRGNSGVIFSQFFFGLSKSAPDTDVMTTDDLICCFENANQYAYKSIKEPVEGTIITAIRAWVDSLKQFFSPQETLEKIYKNAYPLLRVAVEKTMYTLKAQRAMQSEDAGAKAFLYFIEGFMTMLVNKAVGYSPKALALEKEVVQEIHEEHIPVFNIDYRYCTTVLLSKNDAFDRRDIEPKLNDLGDSIVISETDRLAKIHVHTNFPYKVVEMLFDKGQVLETGADDMISQVTLVKEHRSETALVIDSIADVPRYKLGRDTYLLPINILVDDVSYDDKVTAFPSMVDGGLASSSQPNVFQIKKFLKPIVDSYDDVIIITVSSKMSGIYERFREVALNLGGSNSGANIHLIDSKQNSVAEGLVAHYASRLIEDGISADEVKTKVEDICRQTKIYVSLPNLKAMISSGRLNKSIGKFLQRIGYLPLISINSEGKGMVTGLAFSNKANQKLLIKKIKSVKDNIISYAIVHSDNKALADKLSEKLNYMLGFPPLYVDEISSIIRMFSGPGSVAIGYITGEKK